MDDKLIYITNMINITIKFGTNQSKIDEGIHSFEPTNKITWL